MKRYCFGDSKNVFKSIIGQVVTEKNATNLTQRSTVCTVYTMTFYFYTALFRSFLAIPEENTVKSGNIVIFLTENNFFLEKILVQPLFKIWVKVSKFGA
jgi:hypothetical protein